MAKPKPAGATKLGNRMYLFKSSTNSSDCMISAHGGYILENRAFKVPANTRILFYGQHGAALNDPGILTFHRSAGAAKVVETITAGQPCRNYLLSKYQGAHAGESGKETVETYKAVAKSVSTQDLKRNMAWQGLLKTTNQKTQEIKIANIQQAIGGSILTIRNRATILVGVPLKDAIKAAQKEMPSLRVFHCIFCRSNMLGEDKLASQDVDYGVPQ